MVANQESITVLHDDDDDFSYFATYGPGRATVAVLSMEREVSKGV